MQRSKYRWQKFVLQNVCSLQEEGTLKPNTEASYPSSSYSTTASYLFSKSSAD